MANKRHDHLGPTRALTWVAALHRVVLRGMRGQVGHTQDVSVQWRVAECQYEASVSTNGTFSSGRRSVWMRTRVTC